MVNFRIIPVLDIFKTKIVHAVKGERSNYKPLISKLFNTSNPMKIVEIMVLNYNFTELYIADLDSIVNKKPNLDLLLKINKAFPHLKIILDPGISNLEEISLFSQLTLNKLILGIETIDNLNLVKDALKKLSSDRIVISIDIYKGKIMTKNKELSTFDPLNLSNEINHYGVKEIIVLDLFRIGQKIGGIPDLYLKIRENFEGKVIAGGGIKDFEDLLLYYDKKFSGVLIGTALYDGTIKIEDVEKLKNKTLNQ